MVLWIFGTGRRLYSIASQETVTESWQPFLVEGKAYYQKNWGHFWRIFFPKEFLCNYSFGYFAFELSKSNCLGDFSPFWFWKYDNDPKLELDIIPELSEIWKPELSHLFSELRIPSILEVLKLFHEKQNFGRSSGFQCTHQIKPKVLLLI